MGVVTIVGVAVGIAFYATCWGGFFLGAGASNIAPRNGDPYGWVLWGLITGVGLGIIVAFVVAFFLLRRLWPHRDKSPKPPDDVAGPSLRL